MEVTPATPKPRPTRDKLNSVGTPAPATSDKLATKPARSREAAPETEIIEVQLVAASVVGAHAKDSAALNQRIATTAYFLAAGRNFESGHELEDWLEAERRVRAAG